MLLLRFNLLILAFIIPFFKGFSDSKLPDKILICGVCKDVESSFKITIENIEKLGNQFADYAVFIYENNSTDSTARMYHEWAISNPKVTFISENMHPLDLPTTRIEKISRARNIVLDSVRRSNFSDFPYLIMVDLDFLHPWPIEEIIKSIYLPIEWDCISANGKKYHNNDYIFYDRYAFRDKTHCLGPELIDNFWDRLLQNLFDITGEDLLPVFSSFGGLAIYKTTTILQFSYSGIVRDELTPFYQEIFLNVAKTNQDLQRYLAQNNISSPKEASLREVVFRSDPIVDPNKNILSCCEHVTLHAAMYIHGYKKFYINPKLIMYHEN